jgi:hypothetical protein
MLQLEKLINEVLLHCIEFAIHSDLDAEKTLFKVSKSTHLVRQVSWKYLEILIGHTIRYIQLKDFAYRRSFLCR